MVSTSKHQTMSELTAYTKLVYVTSYLSLIFDASSVTCVGPLLGYLGSISCSCESLAKEAKAFLEFQDMAKSHLHHPQV